MQSTDFMAAISCAIDFGRLQTVTLVRKKKLVAKCVFKIRKLVISAVEFRTFVVVDCLSSVDQLLYYELDRLISLPFSNLVLQATQ